MTKAGCFLVLGLWATSAEAAAGPPAAAPAADAQQREMTELFDRLCLQLFPDEDAVNAELNARGAKRMSAEEVRVYLHDDPGTGWLLAGKTGAVQITMEAPPYHACTIRMMTPAGFGGLDIYRAVSQPYEATHGPFLALQPYVADMGEFHSVMTGEQARRADGSTESLLVASVNVRQETLRARGDTGVEVRFVRQLVQPLGPST